MATLRFWMDQLCVALLSHKRIHADAMFDDLRRAAEECGLIKQAGNGWYTLTDYGRDHGLQLQAEYQDESAVSDD